MTTFARRCHAAWLWIKQSLPDSKHPAASQPTPFNLNRYVLLVIYMVHVMVMPLDSLGWGALRKMLFRAQAYLWLCTVDDYRVITNYDEPVCKAQYNLTETLYSCCYATRFIMITVAGFLVEIAGPKVTALLGGAFSICGWMLLGASSESFIAFYPAFILIGAGAGLAFLPALCIVNLFPGSFGFSLATMGAASSLSLALPSLLNFIHSANVSFRWVCWGYVAFGVFLGVIIIILFIPLGGFVDADLFVLVRTVASNHSMAGGGKGAGAGGAKGEVEEITKQQPQETIVTFAQERTTLERGEESLAPIGTLESTLSTVTDNDFFLPFRKEACTFLYGAICLYFTVCSLAMVFYQKTASLFLDNEAYKSLEIAAPLSVIPCFILGSLYVLPFS